jgi:PleD family two-component response regulator
LLKTCSACQDAPIIVLSNLGQEADVEKAKNLGAVDFIIKGNVDIEDVVAKVKKYARGNDKG